MVGRLVGSQEATDLNKERGIQELNSLARRKWFEVASIEAGCLTYLGRRDVNGCMTERGSLPISSWLGLMI